MPLTPVIAAALTDGASRYAILTISGNDVLQKGASGAGVDIDSIEHRERGPGGVSELTFTILDPSATVTLTRNAPVYFSKIAEAVPVFQGFVTSWEPSALGPTGRQYKVRCSGLEIVLDWAKVINFTFEPMYLVDAVQLVVTLCMNGLAYPLNVNGGGVDAGSYAQPVGAISATIYVPVTIPHGSTLREAIRMLTDAASDFTSDDVYPVTVDSMGGLRVWSSTGASGNVAAGGMAEVYVTDAQTSPANGDGTSAGQAMVAGRLHYSQDATAPTAVYVTGTGGVFSLVEDGSTDPRGDLAILNDDTLTTVAQCEASGRAYLRQSASQLRADFVLLNKVPKPTFRAGSLIRFTDTVYGASDQKLIVYELVRTFSGQLEHYRVTMGGGGQASVVNETRRLTREVLN